MSGFSENNARWIVDDGTPSLTDSETALVTMEL